VRIRVPADVDMADRIFAGLTPRQLAILGADALVLLALYAVAGERLPLSILGIVAVPIAVVGLMWATTSPQGTTWERVGLAAVRHFTKPRRRVLAPEMLPESPAWLPEGVAVGPLEFPVSAATDDHVDLGAEGAVAICRASSVNFALRSETEQEALIDGFAGLLNALDAPTSFLVRSDRTDLRETVVAIEERSISMPHPHLEAAAREHASFLRSIAARHDVLSRQVLVCFREPLHGDGATATLTHRVDEAAALLRGLGIRLVGLEADEAARVLRVASDPEAEAAPVGVELSSRVVVGRS
jgi:PrgI family protein